MSLVTRWLMVCVALLAAPMPAWAQDAACKPLYDAVRKAHEQPGVERTSTLGDPAKPDMTMVARKTAAGWYQRMGTAPWRTMAVDPDGAEKKMLENPSAFTKCTAAPPNRSTASRRASGAMRWRRVRRPRRQGCGSAWREACRSRCRATRCCRCRRTRRRPSPRERLALRTFFATVSAVSATLRLAVPTVSVTSPSASSCRPSSTSCGSSVHSPTFCFALPLACSTFPVTSSLCSMTALRRASASASPGGHADGRLTRRHLTQEQERFQRRPAPLASA